MKTKAPPAPLANPLQIEALAVMFALTPPTRRIAVAAAYLGMTPTAVFDYAGITWRDCHNFRRRQRGDVPSHLLVRLARVLGVPFWSLWDDEALDIPSAVLGWKVKDVPDMRVVRRDARG